MKYCRSANKAKFKLNPKHIDENIFEFLSIALNLDNVSMPKDIAYDSEAAEYGGCQFRLNDHSIIFRVAKITPKKMGQFVTLWTRGIDGIIKPLTLNTCSDLVIIKTQHEKNFGAFIFPKAELLRQDILAADNQKGKLAFRLYPAWDTELNNNAIKTQLWQKEFFVTGKKDAKQNVCDMVL